MTELEKRLAAGSVKYELLDKDGESLLVCDDLEQAHQLQSDSPAAHGIREIRCLKPTVGVYDCDADTDWCLGRVRLVDPYGTVHTFWGEGGTSQTLVELYLLLEDKASWSILDAFVLSDEDLPRHSPDDALHSGNLTREILNHITPENAEFALFLLENGAGKVDFPEDLISEEWNSNVAAYTHEPICGFRLDETGTPILTPQHLKGRYRSVLGYFFLEALDDFELSLDCQNLQDQAMASQDPAEILRIVMKLCHIGSYEFSHPYSAVKLYLTGSL